MFQFKHNRVYWIYTFFSCNLGIYVWISSKYIELITYIFLNSILKYCERFEWYSFWICFVWIFSVAGIDTKVLSGCWTLWNIFCFLPWNKVEIFFTAKIFVRHSIIAQWFLHWKGGFLFRKIHLSSNLWYFLHFVIDHNSFP